MRRNCPLFWEVHSQFGVRGKCYSPPRSRAGVGQRRALGGLQGREGPPRGLDPQEDSLDRGSPALPSSIPSLPPRGSLASFGHCTLQGCAEKGSGCPRDRGRAAGSPPGTRECRCICHLGTSTWLPLPTASFPVPPPARAILGWARPGRAGVRHLLLAPDTLGAES